MRESNVAEVRLDLDNIEPIEVPFTYRGKEYVLREATEAVASRWQNHNLASAKVVDGKITGVSGLSDGRVVLLSGCVFETTVDGDAKAVPVKAEALRGWQAKVIDRLFLEAKKISGLDAEDTEESLTKEMEDVRKRMEAVRAKRASATGTKEKNDLDGGTDTSSSPTDSESNSTR